MSASLMTTSLRASSAFRSAAFLNASPRVVLRGGAWVLSALSAFSHGGAATAPEAGAAASPRGGLESAAGEGAETWSLVGEAGCFCSFGSMTSTCDWQLMCMTGGSSLLRTCAMCLRVALSNLISSTTAEA
eukprot:8166746-Alexandrium_andersonii.AAC.2